MREFGARSREAGDPVDSAYRLHSRAVLASLVRLLGGFDLAEEGLHEAFLAAATQWPRDGVPRDPRSWLISAGRFRVIDRLRSKARLDAVRSDLSQHLDMDTGPTDPPMEDSFPDDRLRLIFICCHPALPVDAQVAMALREVCGLTTEQIAAAFLASAPTIAQRIVRAKARIRDLALPYVVPGADELEQRMEGVLRVIYLIFTEGYANPERGGSSEALCNEAIRLARLLRDLLSDGEVIGLLALMLLQDSRRTARLNADGDMCLLDDQDRALWDGERIVEGYALAVEALSGAAVGAFALQAAIAACYARAPSLESVDWDRVLALYDLLTQAEPSPVIKLNRAVALSRKSGAAAGLAVVDGLLADGELQNYGLVYAVRAQLCRQLGRSEEARTAFECALPLARSPAERRWIEKQIAGLDTAQLTS
jgi:RNA polymerase sigma-70 factor (ECF subfamily)